MARKYKKGRASRKGKTSYQSYLEKRQNLENEGYTLRPVLSKEEFERQKNNARLAGQKNFARQRASWDRYSSKADYYELKRKMEELDQNDDLQGDMYNKYSDMKWSEMKKWNNQDWSIFRDDLIAIGGTYDEFRGIYE